MNIVTFLLRVGRFRSSATLISHIRDGVCKAARFSRGDATFTSAVLELHYALFVNTLRLCFVDLYTTSVGQRQTSLESCTSLISGSIWRLHPSTKSLATSQRMEIILSVLTALFRRRRLPRSKFNTFNNSLILFNAFSRFIDSQLQLEADAREALPYVGVSPCPH